MPPQTLKTGLAEACRLVTSKSAEYMKCRLCKNSENFGKSHIIPESFFLNESDNTETPLLVTDKQDEYPKKRPIGEYDILILCKECEKIFGVWDNYAKILLIDGIGKFEKIIDRNIIKGYQLDTYNYAKIKLFFISVLWRAGISQREFFSKVALGPHDEILREMILNKNPGSRDDYSVQLQRFDGLNNGVPVLMPLRFRTKYGFIYYRIYLGRFFYDIKVDSRKTPNKHRVGELEKGQPLVIANIDLQGMNEYKILKRIVNSPDNATAI